MILEYKLNECEKDDPIINFEPFIMRNLLFILDAYLEGDKEVTIKVLNSTYGFKDITYNIEDLIMEYLSPKKALIYIKYLHKKLNKTQEK